MANREQSGWTLVDSSVKSKNINLPVFVLRLMRTVSIDFHWVSMVFQYPLSYLTLAVTCFGCSGVALSKGRYLPVAGLLIWIGGSFLLLALAYWGNAPFLLGKRASGGRNPLSWILVGPYLLVSALSQALARSKSPYTEVAPGLYMGRHLGDDEAEAMVRSTGVRTVIDLAAEHTEASIFRTLDYCSLPVLDAMPLTAGQLRSAVGIIQQKLPGGPVFVHCALGFGRSGCVAAAYLIAAGLATDVKNALSQLKRIRPGITLSRGQRDVVEEFRKS
jgi:hypothetical protein